VRVTHDLRSGTGGKHHVPHGRLDSRAIFGAAWGANDTAVCARSESGLESNDNEMHRDAAKAVFLPVPSAQPAPVRETYGGSERSPMRTSKRKARPRHRVRPAETSSTNP
jgi:hypothetical protein